MHWVHLGPCRGYKKSRAREKLETDLMSQKIVTAAISKLNSHHTPSPVKVDVLLTYLEVQRRPLRPPARAAAQVRVGYIWLDTARAAPSLPTLPEGRALSDGLPP